MSNSRYAIAISLLLSGCAAESAQSALRPAGIAAAKIATLTRVMTITFTVIFFLVVAVMLLTVFRSRQAGVIANVAFTFVIVFESVPIFYYLQHC